MWILYLLPWIVLVINLVREWFKYKDKKRSIHSILTSVSIITLFVASWLLNLINNPIVGIVVVTLYFLIRFAIDDKFKDK